MHDREPEGLDLRFLTPQSKVLRMRLDYFNVLSSEVESEETVVEVGRLNGISSGQEIANPSVGSPARSNLFQVDKQRNRILTADALDRANELGGEDRLQEARDELCAAIKKVENSISASDPFCQQLIKGSESFRLC